MIPIIFGVLGTAACAFLVYVFVQFRREYLKHNSVDETILTPAEIYRMEASWELARMSSRTRRRPPAKKEAA